MGCSSLRPSGVCFCVCIGGFLQPLNGVSARCRCLDSFGVFLAHIGDNLLRRLALGLACSLSHQGYGWPTAWFSAVKCAAFFVRHSCHTPCLKLLIPIMILHSFFHNEYHLGGTIVIFMARPAIRHRCNTSACLPLSAQHLTHTIPGMLRSPAGSRHSRPCPYLGPSGLEVSP